MKADMRFKSRYRTLLTKDAVVSFLPGWNRLVESVMSVIKDHCAVRPMLNGKITFIGIKFGKLEIAHTFKDSCINKVVELANKTSTIICEQCGDAGRLIKEGTARVRCLKCEPRVKESKNVSS